MDYLRHKRTVQAFWIFIGCFTLLFVRLYYLQVSNGAELAKKAYAQQNQIVGLEEVARGDIFDRYRVPLTGDATTYKVVLFPNLVENQTQAAIKLGAILNIPYQDLLKKDSDKPRILPYELSEEQVRQIRKEQIPGVRCYPIKKRYEKAPLAVHLIGHLGKISSGELDYYQKQNIPGNSQKSYHETDLVGKMGLEKYYETYLKGDQLERYVAVPTDAKNRPLKGIALKNGETKDSGRNHLVLTIDKRVQAIVEKVLDENNIASGAAVVMDVKSGDILAMTSRPAFNPENIRQALDTAGNTNSFLDNSVQLVQPGSVFKPVIAAAALELGLVKSDDRFLCLGAHDDLVKCYKKEGHGVISFNEAMVYSCNPVFARVGQRVGAEKIIEYATKLGLNNQEIIGYPAPRDPRQNLQKIKEPYAIVNSSIGQGPVLATPVQITAMMATFARGGVYKKPRVVMEILDSSFHLQKVLAGDTGKRVISEESCSILQEMFRGVTTYGTGKMAYLPGWGSAGKTGSAQIDKSHGIVDAWFTGYAPVDQPRYAVTILVKGGESGGKYAAPVFKEIVQRVLELE